MIVCTYVLTISYVSMDDCVVVEGRQKFFKTFWHTKFKSWMCLLWKMENYYHHFWSVFILTLNILLYHISYKYLQPPHYTHSHVLLLTHWIHIKAFTKFRLRPRTQRRENAFFHYMYTCSLLQICAIFLQIASTRESVSLSFHSLGQ